jgi:hypothetical protein
MSAAFPRAARMAGFALAAWLVPGASAQDGARKQEIVLGELPERTVDDAPFEISAKATSGLPVAFRIVDGPAVFDGKKIRLTGTPGLVVVRASQPGDANWLAARDVERAFTVRPRPSAPAFVSGPMGREVGIGERIVLTAEASGEPLPGFQWRKDSVPITGATSRAFEITSAALSDSGSYDVVASNGSGQVTSAPARINVTKRHQSILFQMAVTSVPAGQTVSLNATATSGLPVHVELVSGVASLSGDTVTSQGGTVVVQADQPGDATFEAALPVTQTFFFTPALGAPHTP